MTLTGIFTRSSLSDLYIYIYTHIYDLLLFNCSSQLYSVHVLLVCSKVMKSLAFSEDSSIVQVDTLDLSPRCTTRPSFMCCLYSLYVCG